MSKQSSDNQPPTLRKECLPIRVGGEEAKIKAGEKAARDREEKRQKKKEQRGRGRRDEDH